MVLTQQVTSLQGTLAERDSEHQLLLQRANEQLKLAQEQSAAEL